MSKTLSQLTLSAAIVLAIGSSASAQSPTKTAPVSLEQGYGLSNQLPAAYNAPSRFEVQNSWDIFCTASFTYWYVDETGYDLAFDESTATNEELLFQTNKYCPGFQVGLGMDFGHDGWVGFAEYTWMRNHSTFNGTTTPNFNLEWLFYPNTATNINSSRHIDLDMIDAVMSRPIYQGRKLTLTPYSGLRGGWLRQSFRGAPIGGDSEGSSQFSHGNSHSWFIGPRAGLASHWLIGRGFRLEGDAGAALVYQRANTNWRFAADTFKTKQQSLLTPIADLSLGLGWGAYLDRQNYHLDFVATYDFMNWWGQNFIRAIADANGESVGAAPGDLHVNGLTLTGRFDF